MIDRRTLLAGGAVLATTGVAKAARRTSAKHLANDRVQLPASFNGVLAYGQGGSVEHLRCVGKADIEASRPVTPATRFKWGSASKWAASTAALRLVEQGRLSLDAPITTYLPSFRRDTGERVQIAHLLSNTSGVPDLMSKQLQVEPALRTSAATPAEVVARFGGGDLLFTPGQGWDYCALNWVILAAIVHVVTGQTLADYVTEIMFHPLRMTETGFAQADQPPMPALAAAYTDAVPPARKMRSVPSFVAASGNVASTPADAVRAAHGIFHGGLIGPASRAALTAIRWPAEEYALGGRVRLIDGEPWAWETGKVEGYRALVAHRLRRSETIVVFNTTDLPQSALARWVEGVARA